MFCTHMYVGKLRKMPSWRASHAARNHLPIPPPHPITNWPRIKQAGREQGQDDSGKLME